MPFWNISLETANEFYTWGWRASMFGALITFLALHFCIGERAFETTTSSTISPPSTSKQAVPESEPVNWRNGPPDWKRKQNKRARELLQQTPRPLAPMKAQRKPMNEPQN